jgi:hypothetical protein
MRTATFIFYLLAAACFFLAWLTPRLPEVGRLNLLPLGLLFAVMPFLIVAAQNLS